MNKLRILTAWSVRSLLLRNILGAKRKQFIVRLLIIITATAGVYMILSGAINLLGWQDILGRVPWGGTIGVAIGFLIALIDDIFIRCTYLWLDDNSKKIFSKKFLYNVLKYHSLTIENDIIYAVEPFGENNRLIMGTINKYYHSIEMINVPALPIPASGMDVNSGDVKTSTFLKISNDGRRTDIKHIYRKRRKLRKLFRKGEGRNCEVPKEILALVFLTSAEIAYSIYKHKISFDKFLVLHNNNIPESEWFKYKTYPAEWLEVMI